MMSKNVFVLTKKFISFALLFIMIIGVFSSFFNIMEAKAFSSLSKDSSGAYLIASVNDFYYFRNTVNDGNNAVGISDWALIRKIPISSIDIPVMCQIFLISFPVTAGKAGNQITVFVTFGSFSNRCIDYTVRISALVFINL